MSSDKPWIQTLGKIYHSISRSPTPITTMICDIVVDIQEIKDYETPEQL